MSNNIRKVALLGAVLIMATGVAAAWDSLNPVPDDPCPCFTLADVYAIPTPYLQCVIDADWTFSPAPGNLTTNIIHEQGISGAEAKVDATRQRGYCAYIDDNDPEHTWVSYKHLDYEQALTCRAFLVEVIWANVGQCTEFCEGDECGD